MPMPSSGVWNTMKVADCAGLQRVEQRLFEDHLGIAAVLEAAHEIGAADILAVDIEAKPVGQQHAERRQHAQDLGLVVGGAQHHHRKADLRPVLGDDVLHHRALLGGGAGRRVADDRPGAMGRLHRAVLLRRPACRRTLRGGKQRKPRSGVSHSPEEHHVGSIANHGTLYRAAGRPRRSGISRHFSAQIRPNCGPAAIRRRQACAGRHCANACAGASSASPAALLRVQKCRTRLPAPFLRSAKRVWFEPSRQPGIPVRRGDVLAVAARNWEMKR